jgi:hypothetical protein
VHACPFQGRFGGAAAYLAALFPFIWLHRGFDWFRIGFELVSFWFRFGFGFVDWFRIGFELVSVWFRFGFGFVAWFRIGFECVSVWFRFGFWFFDWFRIGFDLVSVWFRVFWIGFELVSNSFRIGFGLVSVWFWLDYPHIHGHSPVFGAIYPISGGVIWFQCDFTLLGFVFHLASNWFRIGFELVSTWFRIGFGVVFRGPNWFQCRSSRPELVSAPFFGIRTGFSVVFCVSNWFRIGSELVSPWFRFGF